MSDKAKQEFPLDQFSEAETDEEFGLPELKEHFADTLTPAVLRDWTAKDFASIYVRFRPHLERHARRFLVNPSQVEEVVQDAFLYLMTTLPELDSELGVLKFLKWKVRLLSLDVIRANSRAYIAPLDELPDMESDEPETSQGIERAEDAAIVSMALAKLQPRQRAALIMTLYEELPQGEAAMKLGLSDNAFRQLLLRSRRAFKLALVGEAETAGLSVSQILSLAAKKASVSTLGAVGSVLVIAIAVLPSLVESKPSNLAQTVSSIKSESFLNFTSEQSSEAAGILGQAPDVSDDAINQGNGQFDSIGNFEAVGALSASVTSNPITQKQPTAVAGSTQDSNEEVEMTRRLLETSLDREQVSALSTHLGEIVPTHEFVDLRTIRVDYPDLSAHIVLGEETEDPVQFVYLTFRRGEVGLTAVPLTLVTARYLDANKDSMLELGLTDLIIGDMTGHFDNVTVSDSSLSRSYITIKMFFEPSGELGDARLSIAPGPSLDS